MIYKDCRRFNGRSPRGYSPANLQTLRFRRQVDLTPALAELQRVFSRMIFKMPRKRALVVEPMLRGDLRQGLVGIQEILARGLNPRSDDEFLCAHSEDILKMAV